MEAAFPSVWRRKSASPATQPNAVSSLQAHPIRWQAKADDSTLQNDSEAFSPGKKKKISIPLSNSLRNHINNKEQSMELTLTTCSTTV